jgi:hypothetical protein
VFAVDLDVGDEKNGIQSWQELVDRNGAPESTAVQTPSGGIHIYFRAPEEMTIKNSVGVLGNGIDVRGHGGYVVAPPSSLPNGAYNFIAENRKIAKAPLWLLSKVRKSTKNEDQSKERTFPSEAAIEIPKGKRNDTLFRIACQLREKPGMTEEELRPTVHNLNKYRCKPPLDSAEVNGIVDSIVSRYDRGESYYAVGGDGQMKDKIPGLHRGSERQSSMSYEPFPLDALPKPVRDYVRAASRSLGENVAPAMVALPTLSVLSGAIGDAARLQLKRSWVEPATLWTVLVAPSGSTKSPAFSHAVRPVLSRESQARKEYERKLTDWKAQEDPDERDKPVRRRYRTGDATPEAAVKILNENPRGVLLARDELGAWFGSFDRYVRGAAELQFWIEVWGGVQASKDRVGDGNTTVDSPVVPVTGTIQPGALKEKLGTIHFDTGFAARLILCRPPTNPKQWTDADVSREVRSSYEHLLSQLYGLPRQTVVSLTYEAKALWIDYYDRANASLDARPEGPAKAVTAKGITHTARLALILHLSRRASGETQTEEVDADSMKAAIEVGQWVTRETLRVYQDLGLDAEAVSPIRRFLSRLPDEFRTAEAREIAEEDEIPESTMYDWLDRLQESGDLEKIKRGLYRK